ncbi:MAG: AAA family ATPase, partial [Firmicutes bacterium]|nr:AAA family ATPase [Bacillota bacterium]
MLFYEAAQQSSKEYFKYLEKHGKGEITYGVFKILRDEKQRNYCDYWLKLNSQLKSEDSLAVRIENRVFTEEEIKPIEYNKTKRELKVRLKEGYETVFEGCNINNVFVITDLKFLVRRTENWYKQFGCKINLPDITPSIKNGNCKELQPISNDQREAIDGIFSSPFSYIWGAPGTGKTKVVLAYSVLNYIRSGKKVLVCAPTNNAVEQTLFGLLEVLEKEGVDYNNYVVRLGVASSQFVAKYPGVCENLNSKKEIEALKEYINEIDKRILALKKKREQFIQYNNIKKELSNFVYLKKCLQKYSDDIKNEIDIINKSKTELEIALDTKDSYLKKFEEHNNAVKYYVELSSDLLNQQKSGLRRFLSSIKREHLNEKIEKALDN